MGEVVMISDEGVNLEVMETEMIEKKKEDGSATVVRWERFLPKMVLRVLLVESDDSTRQIVAALLRKCSYKVTAVSDGLKAWEALKGKPNSIDLILTEVDLPSISGFALLTLIMEHDICKNIPIIMMSWHDSVSTVYKCMLRGAADFLVKPVRKNELRNLWQHVWRRQASACGGHGPQDDSVAQEKVEATAENNATSNHSSGYMACVQRNRECIEKGSDAQSSCTKPDSEAERVYTQNVQDLSLPKWSKSPVSDMEIQNHEECVKSSRKLPMQDCEDRGLVVDTYKDANAMTQGEYIELETESEREHANIISEVCDNNRALVSSAREAIDLIGSFDNYAKCSYRNSGSNNGTNMVDSSLLLDLSLRSHPSGSVNQVSDERNTLNHSDASAFSLYINRALQPLHSSASICNQQKDLGNNSDRQLSNQTLNYNSEKNMLSLATGQSGQAEVDFPCHQQTPFPIPVKGMRFDSLCTAYGSVVPPIFCTQSSLSPVQSPGSARHLEPSVQVSAFHSSNLETKNSQQFHGLVDQNGNNFANQTEHKQMQKLESSEDQRYFSSATDQSASNSFCNGNVDQVPVIRAAAESGNEDGFPIHDINCHRSVLREAALNKFRLKRKERCYEKKVRYESRKKLAEQRPRVKGQFVRQVHAELAPLETDNHCDNSLDC
ncbi:hypothetical protein CsSME_00029464 [Camellia sinensis var. sinensis]